MFKRIPRSAVYRCRNMSTRAAVCEDTVARGYCSPRLIRWLRGILPVLLWTGYLVVGAAIFHAVEEPDAVRRQELHTNKTEETNRTIVSLFQQLLDNMNDTMNSTRQNKILTELASNLSSLAEEGKQNFTRWGFMNSALFCMTVVSTIGYGYLSPKTQLGRGLCIIYALIGIPLNIVVMAKIGNALARGIRSAHYRVKRAAAKLAFWKIRVRPRSDRGSAATPKESVEAGGNDGARQTGQEGRFHLRTVSFGVGCTDLADQDTHHGGQTEAHHHHNRHYHRHHQCHNTRGTDAIDRSREEEELPRDGALAGDAMNDPDFPAWIFVFLVLVYTIVFAMLMYISQRDWTVLDGFYYIIITITTIGFGDLVTTAQMETHDVSYVEGVLGIVIPLLGMILLSAGISMVVSQCGKKTRAIKDIICGSSKTEG